MLLLQSARAWMQLWDQEAAAMTMFVLQHVLPWTASSSGARCASIAISDVICPYTVHRKNQFVLQVRWPLRINAGVRMMHAVCRSFEPKPPSILHLFGHRPCSRAWVLCQTLQTVLAVCSKGDQRKLNILPGGVVFAHLAVGPTKQMRNNAANVMSSARVLVSMQSV